MLQVEDTAESFTFLEKLQEEAQILTNISFIIDKMDKDNHLQKMQVLFDQIMNHEITYTLFGSINFRASPNGREKNFKWSSASSESEHPRF